MITTVDFISLSGTAEHMIYHAATTVNINLGGNLKIKIIKK